MTSERRNYYRIPMNHMIEFKEFDFSADSGFASSKLKDVSGGGVLFESNENIPVGTLIQMKLDIPNWHRYKTEFKKPDWISGGEQLVALGYVVRVEEIDEGRYDLGVVFECMDDDHANALGKYIEELKEEE